MILCCGEALIDMLPRTLPDGSAVFLPVAGGAVFNTAIALGRLGERAGFFYGISSDLMGQVLTRALDESGVDHALCIRSPRPTTLAFVTLKDGHAQYAFYDEGTAGRMVEPGDLPPFPAIDALHFGAISLIAEPVGSALEMLAMREKSEAVISLDPNIRPGFVSDETAYRARLARMLAIADIVKVSDDDLAWLAPGVAFDDWAAQRIGSGTSLVVLTRGEQGARAATAKGALEVPAVPARVVDTVGAGDTFNAGLLAGLRRSGKLGKASLRDLREDELRAALRLAARVAAFTVSRAGANPPFARELEEAAA